MTPTLIQVLAMGACSDLAVVSRKGTSNNTIDNCKTLLPSATEIVLYLTAINELPVDFLALYLADISVDVPTVLYPELFTF